MDGEGGISVCAGHSYAAFTAAGTWGRACSQSARLSIEEHMLVS